MADVTISQAEYDDLREDAAFLRALEQAGVDNWDGYEHAQSIFEEQMSCGCEEMAVSFTPEIELDMPSKAVH